MLKETVSKLPFFKEIEKKEAFIFILGALSIRLISLRKASEILEISENSLINLFETIGFKYSFLEPEDAKKEAKW